MLAYLDDFRLSGICILVMVPSGIPDEKRQARRRNRGTLIRGKHEREGHEFKGLRKNSQMFVVPWKSGASAPRKSTEFKTGFSR